MKKNRHNNHIALDAPERYNYTCIVPVCIIDSRTCQHFDSCDPFIGHKVVEIATKKERCMVWDPIKGTVNISLEELISIYFHIFDNIARKGFKKIIVYYCGDVCTPFESFPSYPSLYAREMYTLHHVNVFVTNADSPDCPENDDINIESNQEKFELEVAVNHLTEIIRCVKNNATEN